jgi:hypothetical protein
MAYGAPLSARRPSGRGSSTCNQVVLLVASRPAAEAPKGVYIKHLIHVAFGGYAPFTQGQELE